MGRLHRQGVSCSIKMPAFGGAGSVLARDVTVSPPGHVAKLSTPFDHIWPRPDHMHRDTVRHGLWVYMAVRDIIFKCTEKCLLCSQHLTVYTYLWFKIDVEETMLSRQTELILARQALNAAVETMRRTAPGSAAHQAADRRRKSAKRKIARLK